jgi:hypothetical protein
MRAAWGLPYTAPGLREVVHDVREVEGYCNGFEEGWRCGLEVLAWVVGFVVDGFRCWRLRVESSCLKAKGAWTACEKRAFNHDFLSKAQPIYL